MRVVPNDSHTSNMVSRRIHSASMPKKQASPEQSPLSILSSELRNSFLRILLRLSFSLREVSASGGTVSVASISSGFPIRRIMSCTCSMVMASMPDVFSSSNSSAIRRSMSSAISSPPS